MKLQPAAVTADPERVLSPAEAAAFLNVHPATLRRLKASGQISYVAVGRGGYRRRDLIAYRDALLRRETPAVAAVDHEDTPSPRLAVVRPQGWNEVTRRPFGMSAEQWARLGLTRAQWEVRQQEPRRRKANR